MDVVIVVLAVALVVLVATDRGPDGAGELPSLEQGELEAAREAKYREIRDAELDYRTGKLSREDYEAVDGALRAEALEILNRLQATPGGTAGG
jgi:hypothetical protein